MRDVCGGHVGVYVGMYTFLHTSACRVAKQRSDKSLLLFFLTVQPITDTQDGQSYDPWSPLTHRRRTVSWVTRPWVCEWSHQRYRAVGGQEAGTLGEARRWRASCGHVSSFCDPSALPFILLPYALCFTVCAFPPPPFFFFLTGVRTHEICPLKTLRPNSVNQNFFILFNWVCAFQS